MHKSSSRRTQLPCPIRCFGPVYFKKHVEKNPRPEKHILVKYTGRFLHIFRGPQPTGRVPLISFVVLIAYIALSWEGPTASDRTRVREDDERLARLLSCRSPRAMARVEAHLSIPVRNEAPLRSTKRFSIPRLFSFPERDGVGFHERSLPGRRIRFPYVSIRVNTRKRKHNRQLCLHPYTSPPNVSAPFPHAYSARPSSPRSFTSYRAP